MGYNGFSSGDVEPAKKGTRLLATILLAVSFPLGFSFSFFWVISLFCLLFFWYDLVASANPVRDPNSMYEKEKAEAREQYLSIAKFFIVILFISVLAMILAMTLMGVLQ